MSLSTDEELWRLLNDDSGDIEEDFRVYLPKGRVKIDRVEVASDLDIDLEAVTTECDETESKSDDNSGSSADRLPDLANRN